MTVKEALKKTAPERAIVAPAIELAEGRRPRRSPPKEAAEAYPYIEAVLRGIAKINNDGDETLYDDPAYLASAVEATREAIASEEERSNGKSGLTLKKFKKLHHGEIATSYANRGYEGRAALEKFRAKLLGGALNHRVATELIQDLVEVNVQVINLRGKLVSPLCSGETLSPPDTRATITLMSAAEKDASGNQLYFITKAVQ
jgi:hypothetical protein